MRRHKDVELVLMKTCSFTKNNRTTKDGCLPRHYETDCSDDQHRRSCSCHRNFSPAMACPRMDQCVPTICEHRLVSRRLTNDEKFIQFKLNKNKPGIECRSMPAHRLSLSKGLSAKELGTDLQGKVFQRKLWTEDDHTRMRTNKGAIRNLSNTKQKKTGYNCHETSGKKININIACFWNINKANLLIL